jgi:ABC-2 type transport system permease protein
MLLRVGDRMERVVPSPEGITKADLKESILESLKRAAPGFLTTVGLSKPEVQPPNPQLPPQLQQQQQRDLTRALSQALSENTEVEEVDLTEGRVPSNVDVLLVYAPKDFGAKQRFAIDQFLMRGGTVLLFSNPFHMKAGFGGNLQVEKVSSGLSELLDAYGITVRDELVMDLQNEGIPVPVQRDLGGFTVREVRNVSYPFFVDVRPGSLGDSVVTAGLPALTLPFASPVIVEEKSGEDEDEASPREVVTLIESSPDSWTTTRTDVQPDFETHPDNGFAVGEERKRRPLAALVTGSFTSAFDGKEAPIDSEVLVQSPDTTRLAVVGSTAVLNDLAFQLSRQASTGLQLVQNLVDWGVADTELLSIRSGGTFARTLKPLEPSERAVYEYVNYGIVIVALGLLVAVTYGRRRRMKPIALDGTKTAPPAGAVPSAEAQS